MRALAPSVTLSAQICDTRGVCTISPLLYTILENVEHCGGKPEQADTGYYVIDR